MHAIVSQKCIIPNLCQIRSYSLQGRSRDTEDAEEAGGASGAEADEIAVEVEGESEANGTAAKEEAGSCRCSVTPVPV